MSQITIIKVEKDKQPKGYYVTSVSYKAADGKVKGMKVYPFGEQAEVAKAFEDAQPGDVYDAQFQKNAKDFWEFKPSPTKTGAKESVATPAGRSDRGGNWETAEERAQKQVYIVRQSSITNATQFLEATKGKGFAVEDVLKLADVYFNYVMTGKQQIQTGEVE